MALTRLWARLEQASALDRIGEPLRRGWQALVRDRVRDVLQGVPFGHPLHPAAVHIPVGAWLSAAVCDAIPGAEGAATVLVGVGTASAVPAATAGLTDWSSLSRDQRRVGLVHAAGNTVALALYTGSLAARLARRHRLGRALAYAGLGVAGASAYVGGHLSYRQAAGVNHAAPLLDRIPPGWHHVCEYAALTEGKPAVYRLGQVPVLVSRHDGGVTVMLEWCAHHAGPLGEGEVTRVAGEDCVVCPWHGSTFRLSDGAVVHGPAASDQPLLRSRVVGGQVEAAAP
jgi:nitrite reductase/ring-hydroxylating ferredoxin subunit/uncharacterized membrane protein